MPRCPRTVTDKQWSAYKARIIREAREEQAAAIRRVFSGLLALLARALAWPSVPLPASRNQNTDDMHRLSRTIPLQLHDPDPFSHRRLAAPAQGTKGNP